MSRKRWIVTILVVVLGVTALWAGGGWLKHAIHALHGHHE